MEGVGLPIYAPTHPHSRPASLLWGPGQGFPRLNPFFFFLSVLLSLAALGICCCGQPFSSCDARASHGGGFSHCGAPTVGARVSVVVAKGLRCSACGIFPDQGLNLCLLHWQGDS